MKKNYPLYNDEIDLIALFKIIWDGKIKILLITLISFIVGFGYNSQIPASYSMSLTINPYKNSEFIKFDNIRTFLKPNQLDKINQPKQSEKLNKIYQVRFINELADYEEFLISIKNTKKVQEHFSKLNNENQEIKLFQYAKLLEINAPKKKEQSYIINFNWHDPEEAKKILRETLNLTSKNLKIDIHNELMTILEFEKKLILKTDTERLEYLKEQSSIAKELNIVDNQIDNVNLSQSNVSLSINTADIAYYLRGYKAIDKEIELIKGRDYQNLKTIEQEINSLKDLEINYVEYNIYLLKTKSLKNTKLILLTSILSGLIIGVFFVFISNALQSSFLSKKKLKKLNKI